MMHHNYHFDMMRILHDKMGPLYAFTALFTFVRSLIGIFIPVYLFKIGYSFVDILIYLLGFSIIYVILAPLSVFLISKLGFKKIIILSFPFYILQIIILNFASQSEIFFHLTWICFGVYVTLFWPAMHSEIAANGSSHHRGSQIGTLQILTTIFATFAPFIGGIILEAYGYFLLLVFAISILVLASLFLLSLEDIKVRKYHLRYSDYFVHLFSGRYKNSKYVFANEGIEHVLSLGIWPLLLFILLGDDFAMLGALFTFTSLLSVMFILYFKSYIDRKPKQGVLNLTSKYMSANWFIRSLALSVGGFFIVFIETFAKIVIDVFRLSYMSIFYNNAKHSNYLEYSTLRELYLHMTRIVFLGILVVVFSIYPATLINLSYVIVCGVAAAVGLGHLRENSL